jgi:lactate permease
MIAALSFLPIVLLLALSLTWGVRQAIFVAFAAALGLFFLGQGSAAVALAGLVNAGFGTVTILMIVGGALLLYAVMDQTGALRELQDSLDRIHPDRQVRFFFLALFLTAFFESVAGFGTPGVVVPLLLISMGFSPALSIATVLVFNGLFAVSGAIGTPVTVGYVGPLDLAPQTIAKVYGVAGLGVAIASVPILALLQKQVKTETGEPASKLAWAMLVITMLTYALLASRLQELTGIAAAGALAVFGFVFVFKDRRLPWRPWLPYGVLIALLLLPKIVAPLADTLAIKATWADVFGTGMDATLQPLRSPFIPFVIAACFALLQARRVRFDAKPVARKAWAVTLILFPSLAITQFMLHGGPAAQTTMVEDIASVFVYLGSAYPLFSPLLAVLGTFMTGSTTVSNVIFGPVQSDAAAALDIDQATVLGIQLAGASIGNAVCLFNIIAAAAIVGMDRYQTILRRTIVPAAAATLTLSLLGFLLVAM